MLNQLVALALVMNIFLLPLFCSSSRHQSLCTVLEFMWARNQVGIGLSYRPAGYVSWRDRFLGIDSLAPLTSSVFREGANSRYLLR